MSSIPYNYGSYIDAKVSMTDTGHVSASKQIQSPASAGSRGLAKTTQFTNDRTQMQMGQKEGMTPMAESMVEIRSILDRIDGVNVPGQEDAHDDFSKVTNALIKKYGEDKAKAITDYAQIGTDSAEELMKSHGLTHMGDGKDEERWFQKYPWLKQLANKSWMGRLKDIAGEGPDYGTPVKMEDISDKGRIALEKAGFDPMKVKEYMAVFNDHGDTSDIDQMNMDKVGLADAMSMVLASHDVENESYQPFPEGDEFDIAEDEDFEEVLGPLGFPEDETELFDAEYRGRKVPLNKPMRGDVKKFKVYVKDPKTGNVKKVNFGHGGTSAKKLGQKTMKIRKSNPKARKSFRARHNCANPGPKTKARYWSCRKW